MYNELNIFAKIIRGEVPCRMVFEDDAVLAFHDISPRCATHVLVVPKTQSVTFADFVKNQSPEVVAHFFKMVERIARDVLNLESFRLNVHNGENEGQEVPHFHIHILSNSKS